MACSPRDFIERLSAAPFPSVPGTQHSGAVFHREACDCLQLRVLLVRLLNFVSSAVSFMLITQLNKTIVNESLLIKISVLPCKL